MRAAKYLDQIMQKKKLRRDKELAEWLQISPAAVAQYRSGVRTMDNEKCIKIAIELGIDPIEIIMASDIDRAERAGQKSLWEVFTTRTAQRVSAVLALCFVTSFLTPTPAEAATARVLAEHSLPAINYAKFRRYLRRLQMVLNSCINRTKFTPSEETAPH
ncbi:helix-turn-helix domain-containing protein [Undibacterium oligocarboniphilum]|nr:helix-turn-helix domain-containing protein [Undibacterium oligocarboniphilum]MBC3871924.1 helix-turn-helix domain-containing protein [Undibacterium oligocarboniphilum]